MNKQTPIILASNDNDLLQYWEFPNDQKLWDYKLGEVNNIQLYQDSLKNALGEAKYENAVLKEGSVNIPTTQKLSTDNGDAKNAELIHNGTLGSIRKINFLEAQLLNYQLAKYPLFSHPTEFVAYITMQDSSDLIRVYFCSSDKPWPPKHHIILSALKEDLTKGWRLKYALHNHYEPASNDFIGILAPSMADAQFFKMLKENYHLETALITNSFHTVVIDNKDFKEFEAHQ